MRNRKIASVAVISALLISTVAGATGCHKSTNDSDENNGNGVSKAIVNDVIEIDSDSVWFDYTSRRLEMPDTSKYEDSYINSISITDDGYAAMLIGYTPDDFETESHILRYDKDLKLIADVLVTPDMFDLKEGTTVVLNNITVVGNEIFATITSNFYDRETYKNERETFFYNFTKDEIINLDYLISNAGGAEIDNIGLVSNGTFYICVDRTDSYEIVFGKDGQVLETFDVKDAVSLKDLWGCYFESTAGNKVTFSCLGEKDIILTIDTSDWSYTADDDESIQFSSCFQGADGNLYVMKDDGFYAGEEMVMPFSSTYANQSKICYGEFLYADGDNFVIQSYDYQDDDIFIDIYTFEKASTNPNVGKTLITVGTVDFDASFGAIPEAISLFNQSSDDYFVQLKPYNLNYDGFDNISSNEAFIDYKDSQVSSAANELTMDLLSGEGPDILIDMASMTQLNSEEYLYDISEILDEIGDVELYGNVVEASKIEGKLYQMPLAFDVLGIYALRSDVKGECGFTFDEYVQYVDQVCNGTNPMNYFNRKDVLELLLGAMSNEFYDEDGNVNFQNESFYNLVDYCLNNVPESYYLGDGIYNSSSYGFGGAGYSLGDGALEYTQLYNIDPYISISQKYKGEVGLYGLPSIDGRGPAIKVRNSIAISAACSDYEGAKKFVKYFFTDDTQSIWDEMYTNSIMVEANNAISMRSINRNNSYFEKSLLYASEAELNSWGQFRVDESIIDDYNKILKSASTVMSMDPSIYIIINEELPAYFKGQKKIEDVAAIIEDRAQTVVDER